MDNITVHPVRLQIITVACSVLLCGSCSTPRDMGFSGEFEFPRQPDSNGPLLSKATRRPPIQIGGDWFIHHSARSLISGIASIRFEHSIAADGVFRHAKTHWPVEYSPGSQHLSKDSYHRGGVLSGDEQSDAVMGELLEFLLLGIDTGTWQTDPNLVSPGSITFEQISPVCEFRVTLNPGVVYADGAELHAAPQQALLAIAVFYAPQQSIKNREQPRILPQVFVHSMRSTSTVLLLGGVWGERLHHSAAQLYTRLMELDQGLAFTSVTFADDIRLVLAPPMAPGECTFTCVEYRDESGSSYSAWDSPGGRIPEAAWRVLPNGNRELILPKGRYVVPYNWTAISFHVLVSSRDESSGDEKEIASGTGYFEFDRAMDVSWIDLTR